MENEWIEWQGGECPVPAAVLVDVKHRDGDISYDWPARFWGAPSSWWGRREKDFAGDIVAYRLVIPETKTAVNYADAYRPISDADCSGREILACFKHPQDHIGWVHFVAPSYGQMTNKPGYAAPTHWIEIPVHA